MKKIFLVLLLAAFISCIFFSFVADSAETGPEAVHGARGTAIWFERLNVGEHPVTLKYRATIDLGMGEERTTVTINVDGDARCVDLHAKSRSVGVLTVGGETTVMLHDEAVYVKAKAAAHDIPHIAPTQTLKEKPAPAACLRAVGTEEIEGRQYDYEEMAFDGAEPQTFYFDRETGEWRYWRTNGMTLEILVCASEVSQKAFLVPAWYTKVRNANVEDF